MTPSLRQFMIISIVGMTILLLSLLYFHVELSHEYLQEHLGTQNKNLAIVLRNSLLADGIDKALISRKSKLDDSMLETISTTLQRELRWVPVVKAKIYDMDSRVLFSTKTDEIGTSASDNEAVQIALSGGTMSGMVEADDVNEFDNLIEVDNVHQLYIPIRDSQTESVVGVFEIYTEITHLLDTTDTKQKFVFWAIAIILALFYLALAYSFLNIHRLLRQESRQRQMHLNDLRVVQSDLERRVEERTSELDRSRQFLQSIMDNVPEAILTCDSNYVIQSINTSAQSLFSGGEDNLIGVNWNDFFSDNPKPIQYEPENGGHKVTVLKRIDGEEFPADIWIGPLKLADGSTSHIVVVRDITAQLQAREEIETTRQQYFHQEKMAAIGQLAAGILHEVGNPIAAIAGAASEMKMMTDCGVLVAGDCPLDEAVNRNIKLIDEQTTRLGKITREIADFASPRPRQRELLDLNSLLESTAQILTYDQRFRTKKVDIQLDRNLPAIVGVADQLTQVFMNLVINAMDASNSTENRDHHILIKSELDGDRVLVIVQDYGEGMSRETLARALEPFYTTKPVGKGTGLGLSLCNTIVLGHGGELDIESVEGEGTTVRVYLPVDLINQESGSDGTD